MTACAQAALESLLTAAGGALTADAGEEPLRPPHTVVVHAIVTDSSALQQLLAALELEGPVGADFYVRFWAVQLLSRLAAAAPLPVQSAVLARPQARRLCCRCPRRRGPALAHRALLATPRYSAAVNDHIRTELSVGAAHNIAQALLNPLACSRTGAGAADGPLE